MLVNKTVEFFLSEVVRRGEMPAGKSPGLGLDEMPTTKSPGQAAGSERDAGGPESGGSRT